MNITELKLKITPVEVARRYIGNPLKERYGKLWYKSPFRRERTASFIVSEKGFHDFGDSWHGDIISFIERYFDVDFQRAVEILKNDFGLSENEYETPKIKNIKNLQRQKRSRKNQDIIDWFNEKYDYLCDMRDVWQEIADYYKGRIDLNIYAHALDNLVRIDYWLDVFIDYSDEKEILYQERTRLSWDLM